jgi:hypothetical protein
MHEFGHALGLGHASSRNTQNGLELMYFSTSAERAIYPSTLDIYGEIMIFKGYFQQLVQLPDNIPYEIVKPASDILINQPPSQTQAFSDDIFASILKELFDTIRQIWQTEQIYLVILIASLFVLIIVKLMDKK